MVLLVVVNLMVKPYWILGVDRHFQNLAGIEQYGIYVKMLSISVILTMLLDFGINNFNSTKIAVNPSILREQFASLITLKLILSSVFMLLTFTLAYTYGLRGELLLFTLILALNQVIAHFSTFIRSCITGIQLFRTDAFLSATDRLIMILLGLCMFSGILFKVSIFNFILIQTIGYAGVTLIAFTILAPKVTPVHLKFDGELMWSLLKKTFPYALLAFIMLLYTQSDRLLMPKLLSDGDAQNGIYQSGGRLLEAANMMIGATAVIMMPFFARMISQGEDLTPVSKQLSGWMLIPSMFFAVFASTYSHQIMQLLSTQSTDYMADVFSILILCFVPYSFMYTFGSMLTAKAEMKILNIICFIALLVNIAMNLWLIPKYGALGAAYSALATQTIVGLGKFIFAVLKMKLKHPISFYFKLFGFLPVIFMATLLFKSIDQPMEISFVILGSSTIIWLLVFKMINLNSLIDAVKMKLAR